MIGGRRPLQGRKIGDRRLRVERPHAPYFRYAGRNQLVAKPAASVPATAGGRFVARLKALAIGRPLASDEEIGERLSKKKALAIFSSDAISSSAYATEEIVLAFVLVGAGSAALTLALPVAIAIAVLLGIVAFSYRQVCIAYPTGGGSYSVSKRNFGRLASLVAASALPSTTTSRPRSRRPRPSSRSRRPSRRSMRRRCRSASRRSDSSRSPTSAESARRATSSPPRRICSCSAPSP
jgi:hypothetical protein